MALDDADVTLLRLRFCNGANLRTPNQCLALQLCSGLPSSHVHDWSLRLSALDVVAGLPLLFLCNIRNTINNIPPLQGYFVDRDGFIRWPPTFKGRIPTEDCRISRVPVSGLVCPCAPESC